MLGNRTFILLYYKVPNAPVWNDTPPYYSNSHKNVKILMKWDFHSTILQGTKPLRLERHTSIPFKQPQFGLWNWETLKDFETGPHN